MNIGYFGDGLWSHRALDRLLASPQFKVVFIVARYRREDPVLRQYAERHRLPFLSHPNVNLTEFIQSIKPYSADIHVSMSFDQIFKARFLRTAPKGVINCHAGALPFYRGRNVLNWALINGEKKFGVTVHDVDEGIDTGDIILQKFSEITPSDDYASLLDKAATLCAETLHEALMAIHAGKAKRTPQKSIHPVGFYCGRRRPGDERLDWTQTSEQVHNFVRAITVPGPCARTYCMGDPLAIVRTELIPGAPVYMGTPGEVVGQDPGGIVVKTGDRTLRVVRVAEVSETGEIGAQQVPAIPVGTRLGPDPRNERALANKKA